MPKADPTKGETDVNVTISFNPESFYISLIVLTIGSVRDTMLQVDKPRSRDIESAKKKPRRVLEHPRGVSQGG